MQPKKIVSLSTVLLIVGCSSPMTRTGEQELRDRLLATQRAYVDSVATDAVIHISRPPSSVEAKLSDERRAELDRTSGPNAYENQPLDMGSDLLGNGTTPTVAMTLRNAVQAAVENNLNLQIARLIPAVDEARIVEAEAAFDAVAFADLSHSRLDTPQPSSTTFAAFGTTRTDTTTFTTGVRKPLTTGGQVEVATTYGRNYRNPSFFSVNAYNSANISLSVTQPLLRNFGTDVNRAQIELTRSLRKQDIEGLRTQLLTTAQTTEATYWNLVFARQELLIRSRLLDRTIKDRDQIEKRGVLDATPAAITEANSFVEARRADVIRARQAVRQASDSLKQLINRADLPVSDETLILPLDVPADAPIQFSLLDAVTTALRNRPELRRAVLEIDDATIRHRVADNQRLPQLNIGATMRYNGIGSGFGDSYSHMAEGDFIDYILSAQFEMPIGNRAAEASFRQRKIERQAAVINYQNQAQSVVLQVKNALRELMTSYELIGAERASRRAAAENLRALEAQEEAGAALTPEFLDLKLRRQEALAGTEVREMRAMVDYNIAIATLYQTMATLLERNSIDFDPNTAE